MTKKLKENTNPYLDARREWNERYGSYISRARNWRLIALISSASLLLAVCGLFYMGTQNKLIPYIVEVDKLGNALPVKLATQIHQTDDRVIKAMLARFIVNVRSVMVDSTAQKRAVVDAYGMLSSSDPATAALNEYFQSGNSPFERAKFEVVNIEISSVLPISGQTWEIEWVEQVRDRNGKAVDQFSMKAAATIAFSPPEDDRSILKNPIGLYIKELSWSKQLATSSKNPK